MKRLLCFLGLACSILLAGGCQSKTAGQTPPSAPPIMSKSGAITEQDLGIPVYPGAQAASDKSFIFRGKGSAAKNSPKTVEVSLSTSDSVDRVEAFYRSKLSSDAKFTDQPTNGGKLVDVQYKKGNLSAEIQIVPQVSGSGAVIVILSQTHS